MVRPEIGEAENANLEHSIGDPFIREDEER